MAAGGKFMEGASSSGGPRARGTLCFPCLASLVFLAVAVRLYQLQVLEYDKFSGEAIRQTIGTRPERDRRGAIVDARGRTLAISVEAKACALDPKTLLEAEGARPDKLLDRLAGMLSLEPAERGRLAESVGKRRKAAGGEEPLRFVWVKRRLSDDEWAKLTAAMDAAAGEASKAWHNRRLWLRKAGDFKAARNQDSQKSALEAADGWRRTALEAEGRFAGVFFPPEYRRVYPQGELSAHVLGFGDIDGRGLEGVEKTCQALLEGIPLNRMVARDARSRALSSLAADRRSTEGLTVELTLDSAIQAIVEDELRLAVDQLKREAPEVTAHAVVMDPFTGGILAMANYPTFDPNRPGEFQARNRWNGAVAATQEPGSTFKPLVLSASIEEKLAGFDEEIECASLHMENGRTIKDIHEYGRMSLLMAMAKSSNPAMVRVGQRLGPEKMRQYVLKYGFGEKPGSLLPGEAGGRVTAAGKWSSYTMGSVPMGYEINVTVLQMAAAYSVIANGGVLPRPYIIAGVRDASGEMALRLEPEMRRRVISPETAALMRQAMRKVVTDGTGRRANLAEYDLGGKTGTANMMANAKERAAGLRAYSKTRHTANFVGLAPWDRPKAVICVSIREINKYGGEASAPVGAAIARRALAYFGVPTKGGDGVQAASRAVSSDGPEAPPAIYTVGAPDDDNVQSEEIDSRLWEDWIEDEEAVG